MSTAEGFCSPSEDDYLDSDLRSPTDSSEDSVEVKVSPISLRNKRKCAEPRKVQDLFSGPLKKRVCLQVKSEKPQEEPKPFRPWNTTQSSKNEVQNVISPAKSEVQLYPTADLRTKSDVQLRPTSDVRTNSEIQLYPTSDLRTKSEVQLFPTSDVRTLGYFRPPSPVFPRVQDEAPEEPVALIKKRDISIDLSRVKREEEVHEPLRVPVHPQLPKLTTSEAERMILTSTDSFPKLQQSQCRKEQRNYKNMTRERRIEANARERTRVHTISAAFDTLRRSIPSYSHNQKLSKLSVLRIACSYIMTLSSLVDDSEQGEGSSTLECVEMVSRTIQREGKLRKKKDESD